MDVTKEGLLMLEALIGGDSARGMFAQEICEQAGLAPQGEYIMPLHGLVNAGLVEFRHRDCDAWPSRRPAEPVQYEPGVPSAPYLYRVLPMGTAACVESRAAEQVGDHCQ